MTKEHAAAFTKCEKNGIKIYLKPEKESFNWRKPPKAKIVINYNGKEKIGNELYEQNADSTTEKIKELLLHFSNKF